MTLKTIVSPAAEFVIACRSDPVPVSFVFVTVLVVVAASASGAG